MRRILAAAAFAVLGTIGQGSANADVCAGNLICAVDSCYGTVNVCPTAEYCRGLVDVCPLADPSNCDGNIDLCFGNLQPGIDCGEILRYVCKLIPS